MTKNVVWSRLHMSSFQTPWEMRRTWLPFAVFLTIRFNLSAHLWISQFDSKNRYGNCVSWYNNDLTHYYNILVYHDIPIANNFSSQYILANLHSMLAKFAFGILSAKNNYAFKPLMLCYYLDLVMLLFVYH